MNLLRHRYEDTETGYKLLGDSAITFKSSITLMERRIAESKKVKICEVPTTLSQISSLVKQGVATIYTHDGFKDQSNAAVRRATHMIWLPFGDDGSLKTKEDERKEYWHFGGRLFNTIEDDSKKDILCVYNVLTNIVNDTQ